MQRGMAPPQGLAPVGFRSKRKVSTPPEASASAAEEPAGPPPMTAARRLRPEIGGLVDDLRQRIRDLGRLGGGDLEERENGEEREWRV